MQVRYLKFKVPGTRQNVDWQLPTFWGKLLSKSSGESSYPKVNAVVKTSNFAGYAILCKHFYIFTFQIKENLPFLYFVQSYYDKLIIVNGKTYAFVCRNSSSCCTYYHFHLHKSNAYGNSDCNIVNLSKPFFQRHFRCNNIFCVQCIASYTSLFFRQFRVRFSGRQQILFCTFYFLQSFVHTFYFSISIFYFSTLGLRLYVTIPFTGTLFTQSCRKNDLITIALKPH